LPCPADAFAAAARLLRFFVTCALSAAAWRAALMRRGALLATEEAALRGLSLLGGVTS